MYVSQKTFSRKEPVRYHINLETQKIGVCRTSYERCPVVRDFPDQSEYLHYDSESEARKALEVVTSTRRAFEKLNKEALVKGEEWEKTSNKLSEDGLTIPEDEALEKIQKKAIAEGFLGKFYKEEYGVDEGDLMLLEDKIVSGKERLVYSREIFGAKKEMEEKVPAYILTYPAPYSTRVLLKNLTEKIEDEELRKEVKKLMLNTSKKASVLGYLGLSSPKKEDIAKGIAEYIASLDTLSSEIKALKERGGKRLAEDYAKLKETSDKTIEKHIQEEKVFWSLYLSTE